MLQMASEKGLSGQEPADVDLDNKDLANTTSQTTKKAESIDATDVIRVDIEYGSFISSSEEVPEEPSENPIEEVVVQASLTKEERAAVYNDNVQVNLKLRDISGKALHGLDHHSNGSCTKRNTHYRWQVSLLLINNEYDINSERASDDANASLLAAMELDARRENGVLRKLLRAPRYFDYPESNWLACNEFSEDDDESNKDKAKKGRKSCYICGDINHSGNRCKKVNACIICSVKGHLVINCPNKNVEPDRASNPCLKCGNTDHDMFSCTNDYDSEDLKAIECYICKEAGHLCCAQNRAEGPTEASCYRCGQSGHFGLECTKSNEITFDPQLLCRKCKERGHSRRQCRKKAKAKPARKDGAATKAKKRKYWNARRRKNSKQTPTGCTSSSQPEEWCLPPVAAPDFGNISNGQP